jgi:hypothetical protein
MDLNYLYHRHGVSLMMAVHASCDRSRHAHRSLAAAYAERIAHAVRGNRQVLA